MDPVAISLGPVNVHWYGLMYLVGFVAGALLGQLRARRQDSKWQSQQVWDLLFFIAIGVIVGGRLGYIVFYNLEYYLDRFFWPFDFPRAFAFWGVTACLRGRSLWLFSRRTQKSFLEVGDFVAPLCPLGFGVGRIGNFINQELWGRVSEAPWAMVFPAAGPEARHPSQLYEALLEGVILFVIVWLYSKRPRATGAISGVFLLSYGVFRFFAEFFREPDAHLGAVALGWVTMGQLLSLPMALFGVGLWIRAMRHR